MIEAEWKSRGEWVDPEDVMNFLNANMRTGTDQEASPEMVDRINTYGNMMKEVSTEELEKNNISTMAVFADNDVLEGKKYAKGFLGGVTLAFSGNKNMKFEMLYQLMLANCKLTENSMPSDIVDDIIDIFCEKLKKREDHMNLNHIEMFGKFMERALKNMKKGTDDDEE